MSSCTRSLMPTTECSLKKDTYVDVISLRIHRRRPCCRWDSCRLTGRCGSIMSQAARLDQVLSSPSHISRPETTGTLSSCIKHSLVLRALRAQMQQHGGMHRSRWWGATARTAQTSCAAVLPSGRWSAGIIGCSMHVI